MMVILSQQDSFASTKISKFSDNAVTSQYGLQVGDEIKKIDNYGIRTYTDVAFALALNKNNYSDFVVKRNGENVEIKNVKFQTKEGQDGKQVIVRDFYVYPIEKTFLHF